MLLRQSVGYNSWLDIEIKRVIITYTIKPPIVRGDLGSIPGHVIPKIFKMVFDTSLLTTRQYKVCIEGKVEQSREMSSTLPNTSVE